MTTDFTFNIQDSAADDAAFLNRLGLKHDI